MTIPEIIEALQASHARIDTLEKRISELQDDQQELRRSLGLERSRLDVPATRDLPPPRKLY